MSPLALHVYRRLIHRARSSQPSITYGELAQQVGDLHPRSPLLHAALGEVSNACRHSALPCLPAIVWRASAKRPSTGYYAVAHPRAHTAEAQLAAWQREHARVLREIARFPPRL